LIEFAKCIGGDQARLHARFGSRVQRENAGALLSAQMLKTVVADHRIEIAFNGGYGGKLAPALPESDKTVLDDIFGRFDLGD
jgi:hypothetical protein